MSEAPEKKQPLWWWLGAITFAAAVGQLFGDWISALGVELGITDRPIAQLVAIRDWAWDTINNRWVIAVLAFCAGWFVSRFVAGFSAVDPIPTPAAIKAAERNQTPEQKRALALKVLGRRMLAIGASLDRLVNNDYVDVLGFRINAQLSAMVQSLVLDMEKAFEINQGWVMRLMDGDRRAVDAVALYLTTIGQLLQDGHTDDALKRAASASEQGGR